MEEVPIKVYDNKPGYKELRFTVAGDTHRRVVRESEVEETKEDILGYLRNFQKPLTPQEVEEYHAARLLLGEVGEKISVLTGIRRYVGSVREVETIAWADAIRKWGEHEKSRGLPEKSVLTKTNLLDAFKDHYDFKSIPEVTNEDVLLYLGRYASPKTKNNVRTILIGFFDWCANWGYALKNTNPARAVSPFKVPPKDPVPFTSEELHALLIEALEQRDIDALNLLIFGAFAGMRQKEISRLGFDTIKSIVNGAEVLPLSSTITKTDSRRTVPVNLTLASWCGIVYQIAPQFRRVSNYTLVHGKNPNRILRRIAKGAGVTWVDNGLRKGYVSCMTELKDPATVAKATGHTEAVLQSDYKALVTREEAEAWFDILPRFT